MMGGGAFAVRSSMRMGTSVILADSDEEEEELIISKNFDPSKGSSGK